MNEKTYKYIADEYIKEYGEKLREELDSLERDEAGRITPALDSRVARGVAVFKRGRYARYTRYAGLAAACLVVALLAPVVLRLSPGQNAAPSASAPAASAPAASAPPPATYELLPLSFDLPPQFTVASVEQDAERTVYRLEDSKLDDVVLTLERSGDISRYDGLTALTVGGRGAFGGSGGGYSLLAIEDAEADILYVITCKYDINTLVLLGESI